MEHGNPRDPFHIARRPASYEQGELAVPPVLISGLPEDDAMAATDLRRCQEILARQLQAAHSEFFDELVQDPEHLNQPSVTIESLFNRRKAGEWVRERRQEDNVYAFHGTRIYLRRAICIYSCYLPDAPDDDTDVLPTVPPEDILRIFGFHPPERLTICELSSALRDKGRNDPGKEMLENRYWSCMGIARDEMNALGISAVRDLAEINAAGAVKAAALCRRYGYGNDFGSLRLVPAAELLLEAGAAFKELAVEMRPKNEALANILDELGQQAIGRLTAPAEAEEFFEKIFRSRGFELPTDYRQMRDFIDEINRAREPAVIEAEPPVPSQAEPEAGSEAPEVVSPAQIAVHGAAAATEQEVVRRMLERGVRQLAEVILPVARGTKVSGDFKAQTQQSIQASLPAKEAKIMWERLLDLITLCEQRGGELARSRGLGNKVFFTASFMVENYLVTVAETPKERFATYVYVEHDASDETADEVFLFERSEAKQLGARTVVHTARQPHGEGHIERVNACIADWIAEIQ